MDYQYICYGVQPAKVLLWGLCAMAILGMTGACSPDGYKAKADEEVYNIIDSKWQSGFGNKANYLISDVAPSPNDIGAEEMVPAGVLSLAEAVGIATAQNRDYQRQKEQLYLAALDLTLVRHQFARQWFGTIDAAYTNDNDGERVGAGGEIGFGQTLATGAQITTSIAVDWARFLTGDPRTSLRSVLYARVTQPLLRGRGRRIATENLTQAERDVLYQIRTFNRYRKEFVVSIVADYYGVLQRADAVDNAERSHQSKEQLTQRLQMEADEGQTAPFQVAQARQSQLNAWDNYVRARQTYEQQLDRFKVRLALPADANIVLDQNELRALERTGITEPGYTLDQAIKASLLRRLDLANSADAIDDAQRKVVVAADNLGAGLDLVADAGVPSEEGAALTAPQFGSGDYGIRLEGDLPLDRKRERNDYRRVLIALQQSRRQYDNDRDEVKLEVRQAYRKLLEEAESYATQQKSLDLARKRVQVSPLLWEAGRANTRDILEAQDALLLAENSLTAALVDHTIAELNFFRDIGILEVRPDGMWGRPQERQKKRKDKTTLQTGVAMEVR